jgi:hypothetical protein
MVDDLKNKEKWFNENYPLIRPHMELAFMRLFLNPFAPWSEGCSDEVLRTIFASPANYKEAMIQHIAEVLTFITFGEKTTLKIVNTTITKALPEVEEAYKVAKQSAGGWSVRAGEPSTRQMAVLEWFTENKNRISYIKKSHLEDTSLYDDGGGQEKRNFIVRLLLLILKQKVALKITFQEVQKSLKNLNKAQQKGWLSQVLSSD